MRDIEASEVQVRWQHFLDEVERGETIGITRYGRRIARIVPEADGRREEVEAAIREVEEFRRSGPRLSIEEILAARHEGHKY